MRAPGEAIGLLALEQAMDELALRARHRSDRAAAPQRADAGPREGRAVLDARAWCACLQEGARRFGWDKRDRAAGAACATATGWSAWAWPPPSAATSCGRPRRRCTMASATARRGRDGHDRHRHRLLHRSSPRSPPRRSACRSSNIEVQPGPQLLSRHAGLGRLVGRLELRRGAARRLHASSRRRLDAGAGRAGPARPTGQRRSRATTCKKILAVRLRRALRRGRRRRRPPARSGCAACWACSPPAGSSTPRRRARS